MRYLFLLTALVWPSSQSPAVNHTGGNSITENNASVALPSGDLIQPFIVGGRVARENEFPWIVNLLIDQKSLCGGVLIDWDLVLTAGHCIISADRISASKIKVTAGDHNRRIIDTYEKSLTASGVKLHEKYKVEKETEMLKNDIALVKLSAKFNSSVGIKTISYVGSSPGTAKTAHVVGWGTQVFGGTVSEVLRVANVTVYQSTHGYCRDQLTESNNQFCAGDNGKDACQGDSGGPIICHSSNTTVCGIVSYGSGCAQEGYPGVYTKVLSYVSWIDKNKNGTFSSRLPSSAGLINVSKIFTVSMIFFSVLSLVKH